MVITSKVEGLPQDEFVTLMRPRACYSALNVGLFDELNR